MNLATMSAWQIFLAGGPIMWPILLCSIFGSTVILQKWLQLRSIKIDTAKFLNSLFDSLGRNKIKEAIGLCDAAGAPIARILRAGILKYDRSREEIEQAMEDASLYEIPKLEKKLSALATIAHVSPLLGFLGTVIGMIKCFQAIQVKSASLSAVAAADLSGGIWQALLSTVAGLIVAIPAYLAYNYFVSSVNSTMQNAERAATELVNFFGQWTLKTEEAKTEENEI